MPIESLYAQQHRPPAPGGVPRFHLIKACGYGFTSDLDHTLGHLLLEEMTELGWRTAGICFLNQDADVTVGDFFTSVMALLPWLRPPHPLAVTGPIRAAGIEAAYRYLIDRYLRPRWEIIATVDDFARQYFRGNPTQAVHVRGSDKAIETANLADGHRKIFETVRAELTANPGLSVFLLTDDAKVRDQFRRIPGAGVSSPGGGG